MEITISKYQPTADMVGFCFEVAGRLEVKVCGQEELVNRTMEALLQGVVKGSSASHVLNIKGLGADESAALAEQLRVIPGVDHVEVRSEERENA